MAEKAIRRLTNFTTEKKKSVENFSTGFFIALKKLLPKLFPGLISL